MAKGLEKYPKKIVAEFQQQQDMQISRQVSSILLLAGILIIGFGLVDLVVYPEFAAHFFPLRLFGCTVCLVLFWANYRYKPGPRSYRLALVGYYVVGGIMISMILAVGGYETPYFGGIALAICGLSLLMIRRVRLLALHVTVLYGAYLFCVLMFSKPEATEVFLANNAVLVGIIFLLLTYAYQDNRLRLQEYVERRQMDELQQNLMLQNRTLESNVAESARKYRTIYDNAGDGIFLVQNRKIVFPNPKAKRLLECSDGKLEERDFDDLILPADLAEYRFLRERLRITGRPTRYIDIRLKTDADEPMWVEVNLVPLKWQGEPAVLHFIRDIRSRKQMENELVSAQKMEAVGALAGGIAHDFNNLLTGIMGNISIALSEMKQDEPLTSTLQDIYDASTRATKLTRQLLSFSRKQVIEPQVVNINDSLREFTSMLRRVTGESITLEMNLQDGLWMVRVDPSEVEQVLVNLAINGRDAMPEGGTLTISTENCRLSPGNLPKDDVMPGDYVKISVSDQGTGMDDKTLSKIFNPFFTTKPVGKGTGLGLAMVREAVRRHKGFVDVSSRLGAGTRFDLYFPMVDQQPVVRRKISAFDQLPKGDQTILMAEDESVLNQMNMSILNRLGYSVLSAADGEQALEISRNHPGAIDLLLTDVIMPKKNGKETADQLVRERQGIKVLFTSGYTDDVLGIHGVLRKGENFLPKPYTPQSLAQKVREVLDQPDDYSVSLSSLAASSGTNPKA